MVERQFNREDARIWHQPIRWFQAVSSTPGARDADRAALVTANRHIAFARHHQRRAATRRAASRVSGIVRIAYGTAIGCMAATGEAEMLAYRLPHDLTARVQNARHNGCVELGHIAFQNSGAVHHWHASDAHIVLDRDTLACQWPIGGTLNGAFLVPGVERIFLG